MKKFFSGFLVLCLSLALLTACGTGGQTGKTVTAGGLTFAKSYSEVYSALTDAQKAIADRDKSLNMSDGTSGDPEAGGKGDGADNAGGQLRGALYKRTKGLHRFRFRRDGLF